MFSVLLISGHSKLETGLFDGHGCQGYWKDLWLLLKLFKIGVCLHIV